MSEVNRRFLLRERPTGRIDERTFELVEEAVPEIGDGEALVRSRWISLDPTNRAWIGETPTYLPPVAIGEVMRAGGLGRGRRVQLTRLPGRPARPGPHRLAGLRRRLGIRPADRRCREIPGVSPSVFLGALGMTGLDGLRRHARHRAAEARRDGRGVGGRRRRRLGGRPAREDPGRARRRHRRWRGEVRSAGGRARLRRGGRLQGGGLARRAEGGDTRRDRRRLRERWRRDHGSGLRTSQRRGARGAVRADLGLQRRQRSRPARATSGTC